MAHEVKADIENVQALFLRYGRPVRPSIDVGVANTAFQRKYVGQTTACTQLPSANDVIKPAVRIVVGVDDRAAEVPITGVRLRRRERQE